MVDDPHDAILYGIDCPMIPCKCEYPRVNAVYEIGLTFPHCFKIYLLFLF